MEPVDRTWLCCVVFCDVVSFSTHSMKQQMEIKACLDTQIRKQLEHQREQDYILLDRGDGAAVCFLVEPETALFFALNLREAIRSQRRCSFPYEVRAGINLGPVKIIRDVNGDKTTLGEGINCAARVMDFAGAGQIFVSRSFYEVIGCLSEEYAALFSYLGRRADKHVREFEIYEVGAAQKKTAATGQTKAAEVQWDAQVLEQLEQRLAEDIGPMARVLVQRASVKAHTLEELEDLVAPGKIAIAPEPVGAPSASGSVPARGASIDQAQMDKVQAVLADYVGPVARVLVKRAAASSGDYDSLCQILAQELLSETEKQSFLEQCFGAS